MEAGAASVSASASAAAAAESLIGNGGVRALTLVDFVGRRVRLCGLQSSAAFNGSEGAVARADSTKGRLSVLLDQGGSKALLPSNLLLLRAAEH